MDRMAGEVLIREHKAHIWAAHVDAGQLRALELAPLAAEDDGEPRIGSIYLGRVERAMARLEAAFVDIGAARSGFLHASQAQILSEEGAEARGLPIEACVEPGDTVLVQCTRPALSEKGAQLSADIHLAGRLVVLAACRSHVALARGHNDEVRARLRTAMTEACRELNAGREQVLEGWVVRSAAADAKPEALLAEMRFLARCWDEVLERARSHEPPLAVWSGFHPLAGFLSNLGRVDAVTVEGAAAMRLVEDWAAPMPETERPRIAASDPKESLYERFDLNAALAALARPRVEMPSGGWLMIEETEAMITIDVNSGNAEQPPLAVNLEAARLAAREIGLRALGGLIAIDFIDMTSAEDRREVEEALAQAFQSDKVPTRIGPISEFGVVEMTRRRNKPDFADLLRRLVD